MAKLTTAQIEQQLRSNGLMSTDAFASEMRQLLGNKPAAMADLKTWQADRSNRSKFSGLVRHLNLENAHKGGGKARTLGAWSAVYMDILQS